MSQLTQEHFDEQLQEVKTDITEMKGEISVIKTDITEMKGEISGIKAVMATKDDIAALEAKMPSKELIDNLYKVTDALVKEVIGYRQEQTITYNRLDNVEDWIKEASPKVNVKFQQ